VPAGKVIRYAIRADGAWRTSTTTLASATTLAAIQVNGWVFAEPTGGYSSAAPAAASGDLSPGARASLAVGITLGVVGLATLAAGIWMLRRARRLTAGRPAYAGVGQHDDAHAAALAPPAAAGGFFGFVSGRRPAGAPLPPPPPQELSSGGSSEAPASPTYYAQSHANPSLGPSPWRGSSAAISGYAASSQTGTSHGGAPGGAGGGGGGWDAQPEQMVSPPMVQPADVMEMSAVASPVLHPGDLQPQGYGPGIWKPGPVYR